MLIAAFALGVFAGFLLFPWVVWKSWRVLARKALYCVRGK